MLSQFFKKLKCYGNFGTVSHIMHFCEDIVKRHSNIPIFIPELACQHQCVFCNQEKISGTYSVPQPKDVGSIVEQYLETIPESRIINIAFYGGSFTGIPPDVQEQYLKEAFVFVKTGRVSGIRLSTRPDYINETILALLKKYGVTTIELGAQSTSREVLHQSGRGHTPGDVQNASRMIRSYGFGLGLQMMIGLPGDSYERSVQTAKDIVLFGAQNTRIYPAIIVKGTALERRYLEGKYIPLSLEQAVEWTKDIVRIFESNNVSVIRMGLHPSDELVAGKSLIGGPFHPSFKEMVMTKIWEEIIHAKLKGNPSNNIRISVSDKQIHYAIGYKQTNKAQLQSKGYIVQFSGNHTFSRYQIDVCDN